MPESKLTQRQKIIFKTIVEEFTRVAEPVGSKTLMQLLDFPVSSATIRNEMAVLEKSGIVWKRRTPLVVVSQSKRISVLCRTFDGNTFGCLNKKFAPASF